MNWTRGLTRVGVLLWGLWLVYMACELLRVWENVTPSQYGKLALVAVGFGIVVPGLFLLGIHWAANGFERRER